VDYDKRNRLPPLRASPYIRDPPPPACALGVWVPLTKERKQRKNEKTVVVGELLQDRAPPRPLLLRLPNCPPVAWASSSSIPPSTSLPTPESSRYRSNRPSHLGLDSRTPILLGFLPSHASTLAATNVALGQWSRAWDLVILAFPSQNQQLSSLLFLILLKYTADRQWPVLICAAVRAMEFLARSMQDVRNTFFVLAASGFLHVNGFKMKLHVFRFRRFFHSRWNEVGSNNVD
jgi:hypothetical protein